jgi:hypothetical protein
LTEESQKKFDTLSTQIEMLMKAMNSQSSQAISSPIVPTIARPAQPPNPSTSSPSLHEVKKLVSGLSYPRVEDKDDAVSLAHNDVVSCTPASQLRRVPSPDQRAFEVVIPQVSEVPSTTDAMEDVGHYHRRDDNAEEGSQPTTQVDAANVTACETALQDFVEFQSPFPLEEERVDYEEDLHDNLLEERMGVTIPEAGRDGDDFPTIQSTQVKLREPYDFD